MKILSALCRFMGYVATGIIVIMMLLTVGDVFMRYTFSSPIIGTSELTERMMICLLLGLAWCAIEGRHINVGIVMDRVPLRAQSVVDIITLLAGLSVYAVIIWQGFMASLYTIEYDLRTSRLDVPEFPFYWVLVLSFAVLCLVMIAFIVKRIRVVAKR